MKLKHWFQGLAAAIVGATAALVYNVFTDPSVFEKPESIDHLKHSIEAVALCTGAAYLIKSPIPFGDDSDTPAAPIAPAAPKTDVQSVGNAVKLLAFALTSGALFSLAACSTTTSNPAVNARNAGLNAAGKQALVESEKVLGVALTNGLLNLAQQEVGGGGKNVDFGQAAAAGLWSSVNAPNAISAIDNTVKAFSAGKAAQTALMAKAVADAAVANGQPAPAVVNAIATVISTAAGAPPAQ
jgi:hypothetical protein